MSRTVAGQDELVESEELFDIVELFAIIDAGEIVLGLLGKLREEVEVQQLQKLRVRSQIMKRLEVQI